MALELAGWGKEGILIPDPPPGISDSQFLDPEIDAERLTAFQRLRAESLNSEKQIILASEGALKHVAPSLQQLESSLLQLATGQELSLIHI